MSDEKISKENQNRAVFFLFCVWSIFLLCRPQDYIPFLGTLRPAMTMGILTLLLYLFNIGSNEKLRDCPQFKLFLAFNAIMLMGIPFSLYRSASLFDLLKYVSIQIPFFVLSFQLINTVSRLHVLLFVCCSGTGMYALSIILFGNVYDGRIFFGSMFDPNDIAFFLICFLPFNLLFLSRDSSFIRLVSLINLIVGLIVLLKSGSRSGFLACLTVFAYLVFVRTSTLNISFVKKAVATLTIVVVLSSLNMISKRYSTILDVKDDYNVTEETGRLNIWKIGLRLMFERPLTGVGMNRFNEGVGRDREKRGLLATRWQSPHNSVVQVGAETGVAGLILYCLMSYRVFTITGKVRKTSREAGLVKIAEMTRAGFLGHAVCAMFISQAYSVYWIFYIVLSAILQRMIEKETLVHASLKNESGLYPYAYNLRRS